jgi:hypothetical protein
MIKEFCMPERLQDESFPEKGRLQLVKLVPQHPFDALGPSDCMSRARFFSYK